MTERSKPRRRPASHRLLQTLILVDVQYWFLGDSEDDQKLLRKILLQIRLARKLGWPIVVVELQPAGMAEMMAESGRTRDEVMAALLEPSKYEHLAVVRKTGTDGSAEVLQVCEERGFSRERFRVIGLTTPVCVTATAIGLTKHVPDCTVEVVRRACAPLTKGCWTYLEGKAGITLCPENQPTDPGVSS